MAEKAFRNTFAPGIGGESIDVGMVIEGLRFGVIREADLPAEVHGAVEAELERRGRELISPKRVIILLIGTVGEVRGRTLLQKYTFLVDMEMYSRKSRDIYTMFGWKAHESGPHSASHGRYVDDAVRDGLVEEFPIAPRHAGEATGYRLTSRGKEMFDGLLGAFQGDSDSMKCILAEFVPEQSVERVASYIHERYPGYAGKSVVWSRVGRGK